MEPERVRAAHADGWAAEGALREPLGGGALALCGIRVAASGLPEPPFNGADVTGTDPDLDAARAYFAERGLGLAVRVPESMPWSLGRWVGGLRLMAVEASAFIPAPPVPGLSVRPAGLADLETLLHLDRAGFGTEPSVMRGWIAPHLGASGFMTALAELDGEPAGTAYVLRTNGVAGPALKLAGVAVDGRFRRRGIAAAMSSWLLAGSFAEGAEFAHLHADSDAAARVYGRLGFVDVCRLGIFVDV